MEGMLRMLRRCLLAGAALAAAAVPASAILPATAVASNPNTALINGDSVEPAEPGGQVEQIMKEGVPISLEQYAAERAGFNVTIVTGAQWKLMTATEFAQYQVLIVGDPNCGGLPQSVSETVGNWAPAVMGAASGVVGNRAVIGTDPEDHYQYGDGHAPPRVAGDPSTSGAEHLVESAIRFAGSVAGATGISYDTSCGEDEAESFYPKQLQQISTGPGVWEMGEDPACGAEIALIASNPAFSALTHEDLSGWHCSAHVSFKSFPADFHALALTLPENGLGQVCGTDIETKEFHCGNAYVLVAGGGVVVENPFIKLTPPSGGQEAGGSHMVVATVEEEEPKKEEVGSGRASLIKAVGRAVNFAVTGQNTGATGVCTTGGGTPDPKCKTDANGQVEFTYPDTHGAGLDTINASVSLPNGLQSTTASWEWTPPPPAPAPAPAAPAAAVLASKAVVASTGSAHIASAHACVASTGYMASVKGKGIASVTYSLDGHKLGTVKHADSHGAFTLRVHLQTGHSHRLSMRVTFSQAAHTSPLTLHRTLARCAARRVAPRFTG